VKHTTWSSGLSADGTGVVAHAGSVAVRLLADRTGLTGELSKALASGPAAGWWTRGYAAFSSAAFWSEYCISKATGLICPIEELHCLRVRSPCSAAGLGAIPATTWPAARSRHAERDPWTPGTVCRRSWIAKPALAVAGCVALAVTGGALALGLA